MFPRIQYAGSNTKSHAIVSKMVHVETCATAIERVEMIIQNNEYFSWNSIESAVIHFFN